MKACTRRLALRAAAKAALSVTVLGCGGTTLTEASGDPAPEAVTHVDAGTCNVPSAPSRDIVSQDAFDCCITRVDGMLGDSGSLPGANEYWSPAIPCCSAIITRLNDDMNADANAAANDFNGQVVIACCETLGEHGFSTRLDDGGFGACTPWGPPVPPEMPEHLFDLEVA
jgi:hypothetical protein